MTLLLLLLVDWRRASTIARSRFIRKRYLEQEDDRRQDTWGGHPLTIYPSRDEYKWAKETERERESRKEEERERGEKARRGGREGRGRIIQRRRRRRRRWWLYTPSLLSTSVLQCLYRHDVYLVYAEGNQEGFEGIWEGVGMRKPNPYPFLPLDLSHLFPLSFTCRRCMYTLCVCMYDSLLPLSSSSRNPLHPSLFEHKFNTSSWLQSVCSARVYQTSDNYVHLVVSHTYIFLVPVNTNRSVSPFKASPYSTFVGSIGPFTAINLEPLSTTRTATDSLSITFLHSSSSQWL